MDACTSDVLVDEGPIFHIVGRAKDSARNGHMRLALRSRKKAPADGGEGGYISEESHRRPVQPIVGRAKYVSSTGACEKCFPNCGKRCDEWKLIDLSQIYAFPALSLIGRAEDTLISSGEEIIAMAEESFD